MGITFTPRRLWLLLALACATLAVASIVLTHVLKLHPCNLCILQRLMFLSIVAFAVMAALVRVRAAAMAAGVLVLLSAATGAGTAGYQVWLQAQPGAEFLCGGADPNLVERVVEWFSLQLPMLFSATGNCASKELVIFGLSLAGWALVSFVVCLLVGVAALWRGRGG